jgi:hypothetical protein
MVMWLLEIKKARQGLSKISPAKIFEFVKIIYNNNSCSRETIIELFRTPSIKNILMGFMVLE